jgi:glycosyltransferase involved in cell wall biosynthesis
MPAYNAERWIAGSIQSALAQDWPRIELIVVDDGSRDGTLSVARRFESARVKVISQENRGAAAARNIALSLAQGDYIQWLDADDLLAPTKLSRQLIDSHSLSDDSLLSSAFGTFSVRTSAATFTLTPLWQDLSPVDWLTTRFSQNLWMNPAVWLVSRGLTASVGPWNEALSLDDDGEYFSRVVARSSMVAFVPAARSYYRFWNAGSLSRSRSDAACRSLLTSLRLSIGYLLSLEDSERTRRAGLQYLQTFFLYFYPEKADLLQEVRSFATSLGGELSPPTLQPHYEIVKRAFGWQCAKEARHLVRSGKLWWKLRCEMALAKILD